MSIQQHYLRQLVAPFLLIGLFLVVPGVTHAMTSGTLEVQFAGGTTLFGTDTAIAPGFVDTKTVTVTNHGAQTEAVYTKPVNYHSTGLADAVMLQITATSTHQTYFNDRFTKFFSPTPVMLGTLAPHTSRTYVFQAGFATSSGDTYENESMAFDLVIGFPGGPSIVTPGGGSGSGGGGGYNPNFNMPSNTPPGAVLGASTTRTYPAIFKTVRRHFNASPVGRVLGASTSAATTSAPVSSSASGTVTPQNGMTQTKPTATSDSTCTLLWLLSLFIISFSWTLYHDLFRRTQPVQLRLFNFNVLAQSGFLFVLLGLWLTQQLLGWQWLLVLWWVISISIDSLWHYRLGLDRSLRRFGYYGLMSILFMILSWSVGVPCIWWPFAILLFVSVGIWRWPRSGSDTTSAVN